MKKLLSLLSALIILFAAAPYAGAEAAAETHGPSSYYSKAWLCGAPYGYSPDVAVLVVTNDPGRKAITREEAAEEIRFFPFDEAAGVYASGEGEPAGERAAITAISASGTQYAVHLSAPGKYSLSGALYYLFDPAVPALRALRAELDGIVSGSRADKDAKTAKTLHDWLCGRVSPVLPEADAERLSAACADPMNALLTGYARDEAYALLNGVLLNAAGVRCLTVRGTAGEKDGAWNLYRQDGAWRWTDAALDDVNDKKGAKYFALDDKAIGKGHALCSTDEAFTADMIRGTALDALLDGKLDAGQLKNYGEKQWDWNFSLPISDGPAWVIGESATVSFRLVTNQADQYRKMTPEEFLEKNLHFYPWMEEYQYYYSEAAVISEEMARHPEIPPLNELVTVEEAADDFSSFTLTFHVPGMYVLFDYFACSFYLISPDQTEPAEIAAQMDAVVEKAKASSTEKQAAQILYNWIRGKVKYNHTAFNWFTSNPTDRDMQTSAEPIGALLYGKCVCGGYGMIYSILLQQAGIQQFPISGNTLPGYEGHLWNINRLDGVWSETDATWGRFAWTAEKMRKDREYIHWHVLERVFYGNAFDLLAEETAEDYKPLAVLPLALKYLPLKAEDYGFPEISEKDLISAEVAPLSANSIRISPSKAAKIRVSRWDEGKGARSSGRAESEKAVKEFTAQFSPQTPMIIEILTYDRIPKMSRPALCGILYYKDGERVGTGARYMIPVKKNEYPEINEYSYRYYEYDGQMKPYAVGWHLTNTSWITFDIQVFFDPEGKAERYVVSYDHLRWEGTPEQPLTRLQMKDIENPAEADPAKWEAIWFE